MPEGIELPTLELKTEADIKKIPADGFQTGKDTFEEYMAEYQVEDAPGDLCVPLSEIGKTALSFDNVSDLIAADPVTFYTKTDDGIPEQVHKLSIMQSAWVIIRSVGWRNVWPDMSSSGALIKVLYDIFSVGMRLEEWPSWNEDWSAEATTLVETIQGLDDHDTGLGAHDYLWKRFARYWWWMGIQSAQELPELPTDFRSTANDTVRDRHIWIVFLSKVRTWVEEDYLMAAQTDVSHLARNQAVRVSTRKDLPAEIKDLKVEPAITEIDLVAGDPISTNITDHRSLTSSEIDNTVLNGVTISDRIARWPSTFKVDQDALNYALNHAGLGYSDENDEHTHYSIGITLVLPTSSGLYDNHPHPYTVGLDLCIFLSFEEAIETWWKDWDLMFTRGYWTWVEATEKVKTRSVNFSLLKNLHGIMTNSAYYLALRALFEATSNPGASSNGWVYVKPRDPHGIEPGAGDHPTNDLKCQVWMIPFVGRWINPNRNLYCLGNATPAKIHELINVGIRFVTSSVLAVDSRYLMARRRLVEIVHMKDSNLREGWMFATAEVPRFESIQDVLDVTFTGTRFKYAWVLAARVPEFDWVYSASRMHGVNNLRMSWIDQIAFKRRHISFILFGLVADKVPQPTVKVKVIEEKSKATENTAKADVPPPPG